MEGACLRARVRGPEGTTRGEYCGLNAGLLATNQDIDEGLKLLLGLCRETVVRLGKTESALVRSLQRDTLLVERVERLMTIPAVGPIMALTWALEVGEVRRFSSIKKAISYCGLFGAERSSAGTTARTGLSLCHEKKNAGRMPTLQHGDKNETPRGGEAQN